MNPWIVELTWPPDPQSSFVGSFEDGLPFNSQDAKAYAAHFDAEATRTGSRAYAIAAPLNSVPLPR